MNPRLHNSMNDNKKIAVNSIVIFARLCITSIIGILASRLVLDALGASDYGLYNVVGGIVTLLNVMNTAMLSTTYRYIAFEIGKGENGRPNAVFNTSLLIHFVFAGVILLLGLTIGLWYINNYLNVPEGSMGDARFVFLISLFTTSFSTLLVPYQGLLVAYERFSSTAIIDIITGLIRFGVLALLLYSADNSLRMYSIIQVCYTVMAGLSYTFLCYKSYFSVVKLKFHKEVKLIKDMMSFALWTLFGAVASIGKTQGCVLLINYFFGTLVNAAYAIGNQIESYVLMFARSLNSATVPQITKSFSSGNDGRSILLTSYISKYTFIMMMMVAFPVLLDIDFILGVWLKEVPEGANLFCRLIILNAIIGCLGEGIPALINATGRIKTYQIIFHTFNLLGLPIAFLAFKLGYNQYSIMYVYIGINLAAAILRLYLLKRLYHFDISLIIKVSYVKMAIMSIPLLAFYYLYNPINYSIGGHLIGLLLSELYLMAVVLLFGTDKIERAKALDFIKSTLHRA